MASQNATKQSIRTEHWHQNPLLLPDTDGQTFTIELYGDQTPKASAIDRISTETPPPDFNGSMKQVFGPGSRFQPPPHYHLLQDEYFLVNSGAGIWHLWERSIQLSAGDTMRVPKWRWPFFEALPASNAPDKQEFSVLYKYDKEMFEMEERYFRNILPYLDDCRKSSTTPSLIQMSVNGISNLIPIDFCMLPGRGRGGRAGEWLNFVL